MAILERVPILGFQSTPSARRATASPVAAPAAAEGISIHALREEGDFLVKLCITVDAVFQSTPSARRATERCPHRPRSSPISIHALREEGDQPPGLQHGLHVQFQSTPSARRATVVVLQHVGFYQFQSTPSARRATHRLRLRQLRITISIHALREEGDCRTARKSTGCANFNPRPPRGGRQSLTSRSRSWVTFQSTPSARRATQLSHHSPSMTVNFNPRPPRGGRRAAAELRQNREAISIHALREEGDYM